MTTDVPLKIRDFSKLKVRPNANLNDLANYTRPAVKNMFTDEPLSDYTEFIETSDDIAIKHEDSNYDSVLKSLTDLRSNGGLSILHDTNLAFNAKFGDNLGFSASFPLGDSYSWREGPSIHVMKIIGDDIDAEFTEEQSRSLREAISDYTEEIE